MKKHVFTPNFHGALQISASSLQEMLGRDCRALLIIDFDNHFMVTNFDEKKPLDAQLLAWSEIMGQAHKNYLIETVQAHGFKQTKTQLNKRGYSNFDLFLTLAMPGTQQHGPFICVQPCNIDALIDQDMVRRFLPGE